LLPKTRDKDEIKMFIEIICINKNFGHPVLDISEGFQEVRNLATKKANIDFDVINSALGIFIRDFIIEYYNKKRKWPPLKQVPNELIDYYKENKYPP
jgi:hypothetical protein